MGVSIKSLGFERSRVAELNHRPARQGTLPVFFRRESVRPADQPGRENGHGMEFTRWGKTP